MRLNFKKISAIAASTLMVGMTIGFAAAANYPNPFVVSGVANAAIVYGTGAGVSSLDLVQAGDIEANLQSYMSGSATTSSVSPTITGEAVDLSNGNGVYVNDTIVTSGKTVLTNSNLPILLGITSFSGNVQATETQTLQIGSTPQVLFLNPTSTMDGIFSLILGGSSESTSATSNQAYNATVTFSTPVNFTSSTSQGPQIILFGQKYTVSAATTSSNLVLLGNSQQSQLSINAPGVNNGNYTASTQATISGIVYTVTLQSASSTSATVLVTDSNGGSQTATINTNSASTVDGIQINVGATSADSLGDRATISVGSNEITIVNGGQVTTGAAGNAVGGTYSTFNGGTSANLSTLTVEVAAPNIYNESVVGGTNFIDPVFGTFEITSPGFNVGWNSTNRQNIQIIPQGTSGAYLSFANYNGIQKTQPFVENYSGTSTALTLSDNGDNNISVASNTVLHQQSYAMLGNQNYGALVQIQSILNQTSSPQYSVSYIDQFTGVTTTTTSTTPSVSLTVGGQQFNATIQGANNYSGSSTINLTISPQSAGNSIYVYPTISTTGNNPAELMYTQPITINLTNPTGLGLQASTNVTSIYVPTGEGSGSYTNVTVVENGTNSGGWLFGGTQVWTNNSYAVGAGYGGTNNYTFVSGPFYYTIAATGTNGSVILYQDKPSSAPSANNMTNPAVAVVEQHDDKSNYNGWIMPMTQSSSYVTAQAPYDTWDNSSTSKAITRQSNSYITDKTDRYGVIGTTNTNGGSQDTVTLSYPNVQLAQYVYMADTSAVVAGGGVSGGSATQLGDILVTDAQVSSVSQKNLIIIGGSCINSVAANLLGKTACGSDFTAATGIGSGQFLIQSFASPYDLATTNMVALLVSGYESADTVNAATFLRTQVVNTAIGNKYVGTSATSATLSTTKNSTGY